MCAVCGTTFKSRSKMHEHANVEHSEAAKLQCRHCWRHFGNTQVVRKHKLKLEEPQFRCGHCYKMLKTSKTLLIHKREHTGERPFRPQQRLHVR